MAKFKKLAMLCAALIATASMATGCSVLDGILSGLNSSSEASSVAESTVDSTVSEEESSEEESSEQVSESAPVEDETNTYYTCIVDGAAASLSADSEWSDAYGEITFTATEAGTYGVYAVDKNFNEAGVYFVLKNSETNSATKYIFDVEEAGDVTLITNNFFYDAGTLEFNYYIYRLNTLTVTEYEGTAELCANIPVPVEVVAPAAGKYVLSITENVVWANDMDDLAAGGESSTKKEFNFSEAGEIVSCYVVMENLNLEGFNFEWKLAEKVVPVLEMGENEVVFESGDNEFTFISETDVTIEVSLDTAYGLLITTNDAWSETAILNVEAGVPFSLNVYFSGWDAEYENQYDTIDSIITISSFVADDVSNITEVGSYTFTATEEGVNITFTAPEDGTYSFFDTVEYSFWFDGSEEGTDYAEFYLAAGESISFISKFDGVITLQIEKMPEIVTLDLGETVVNIPEGENELQFNAEVGEYTLTWDKENIIIYVNGMPYTAGSMFSVDYYSSYAISTVDGSAINDVTFTLAVYVYPTVELGDNTITVNGEDVVYKFDATQPGCYTFTLTGEAISYVSVDSSSAITYPNALEEAGSISINISASDAIFLSISTTAECEITVNVACNTVVTMFEMAVTMDETGTAPVSLTIDSIAPGECIYFAASRMVGDYVLSWSDEYEINIYAGDNIGMYYDPQVRLTRTMMDGPVYIIIRNLGFSEATYENVVLNIAEYEEPAAAPIVGNHDVEVINGFMGGSLTLTAEVAGTYVLSLAEGEENGDIGLEDEYGFEVIELPYTFTLEAGESITFIVLTLNWEPDTINLVVSQAE